MARRVTAVRTARELREVPFAELLTWYDEVREQIADLPEGATFELRPTEGSALEHVAGPELHAHPRTDRP